jgi:hypothetical protein
VYKFHPSRLIPIALAFLFVSSFAGGTWAQDASSTATPVSTPTPTPTLPPDFIAYEIYPKGGILGDFFDLHLDAGSSAELVVVLANTGTAVFEGRTYALNAHSGINGGFTVAETKEEPAGLTTWIDYSEELYTIQPRTGIERSFTINVPDDARPGQYIAALALETADSQAIEGSDNFRQLVRIAVPIVVIVNGPIEPEFEIGAVTVEASETTSTLDVEIINTGNIRVRPTGTVAVSDATGTQLFNAPVTMGSVFAWESTSLIIPLPQPLAPGDYRVTIDLNDPDTGASAKSEAVITATAPATPAPPPPVQFFSATGIPQPDAANVQFLDIAALIDNSGDPITNVRVVLRVTRDGETIEDFALAASLALPVGQTPFQARYIPATGWVSGTWQFVLSVEAVDPSSDVSLVLATADLADLVVP